LSAENTGRSGQPVQNDGGRGGRCPNADQTARLLGNCIGVDPCGTRDLQEAGNPFEQHVGRVFARLRQRTLAVDLGLDVGAAQFDVDCLLDVVGETFLDDEHGAFCRAERGDLLRHQRIDNIKHQHRHARGAEYVGQSHALQSAQHAVGQPAHDDDADVGEIAVDHFIELVFANEGSRRRDPLLDLEPLLSEDHRRMRQPPVFEFRRAGQLVETGDDALAIILGCELAGGVAGADAQFEHHRSVTRFRQFEALLDGAHDGRQVGPWVEQPHRRFQRVGV